MKQSHRIVTRLPLKELWDDSGTLSLLQDGDLSSSKIRELLGSQEVEFVVADIGKPLAWRDADQSIDFWKDHAHLHVADSREICLDEFPVGLAYAASHWKDDSGRTVILLEAFH